MCICIACASTSQHQHLRSCPFRYGEREIKLMLQLATKQSVCLIQFTISVLGSVICIVSVSPPIRFRVHFSANVCKRASRDICADLGMRMCTHVSAHRGRYPAFGACKGQRTSRPTDRSSTRAGACVRMEGHTVKTLADAHERQSTYAMCTHAEEVQ